MTVKFSVTTALLEGRLSPDEVDTLAEFLGHERAAYFDGAARRIALRAQGFSFRDPFPEPVSVKHWEAP